LGPTPNLEDQFSVFMFSSDRVVQLYPRAPGSLFVAFYDSLGYTGGVLPRLHYYKDKKGKGVRVLNKVLCHDDSRRSGCIYIHAPLTSDYMEMGGWLHV
jgi:hypothetical protein